MFLNSVGFFFFLVIFLFTMMFFPFVTSFCRSRLFAPTVFSMQVLSKMGLSPSPAELKAIIQEVDTDGDGEVRFYFKYMYFNFCWF